MKALTDFVGNRAKTNACFTKYGGNYDNFMLQISSYVVGDLTDKKKAVEVPMNAG